MSDLLHFLKSSSTWRSIFFPSPLPPVLTYWLVLSPKLDHSLITVGINVGYDAQLLSVVLVVVEVHLEVIISHLSWFSFIVSSLSIYGLTNYDAAFLSGMLMLSL